jgi:hypothetical protein
MNMSNEYPKKLIEVALPLDAINKASAVEKQPFTRHHPRSIHIWWARRPLAAARAVIFAQMVDDPSAHPDLFPTEKAQEKERKRLFKIIEDLVLWENTTNEEVLQKARDEIWQSWRCTCAANADHPRAAELFDRHRLPAFHDPFAGGGALPLEAQRLGLESYASDLNPVAVLINKAMIEIPPKFAGKPPVNPVSRKENGEESSEEREESSEEREERSEEREERSEGEKDALSGTDRLAESNGKGVPENQYMPVSRPYLEFWLLLLFINADTLTEKDTADLERKGCKAAKSMLHTFLEDKPDGIRHVDFCIYKVHHAIEWARKLDTDPEHRWPNSVGSRAYRLMESILS